MVQGTLFDRGTTEEKNRLHLGAGLFLTFTTNRSTVALYRHGTYVKGADLSDKAALRLFVVDAVELGAMKSRLASALNISRQSIHNYLEIKKYFGIEGLIHSYSPSESTSLRKQRQDKRGKRRAGNKARQVEEIRRKARQKHEQIQLPLSFSFGEEAQKVEDSEQPFFEEHDWQESRYSGVFSYLIVLVSRWKWLELVMGYFGSGYKLFMIFLLMAARNIRCIEQLKNVRAGEAGVLLGIKRLPCRSTLWQWFYSVADKGISGKLLQDYFLYQIRAGSVGLWLLFTDGHLLPYTGKESVRCAYNTQRRMPVAGRTSLVTCDSTGQIVDFSIEEGKGDLRGRIAELRKKWSEEMPAGQVMVFDREGYGAEFFYGLLTEGISFVTWDKYVDTKALASLEDDNFTEEFDYNGKNYGVFEGRKTFTYTPEEAGAQTKTFTLRKIYLWNKSSARRTCALAWQSTQQMTTKECALALLSRWGASENTFKHLMNRHPLHYHPGFKLVKSDNQLINNPVMKEKEALISRLKQELSKLYKKLAQSKEALNHDATPRHNSVWEQVKKNIVHHEAEVQRLKEEKKHLPEKVDVSTLQDYRSFKKIDNEGKYLFDFVTTSVWNARKKMVQWLGPFFDCDNEVVDLFYALTDCHGWIKSTKTEVIVRLEPLQQPKRRLAQEQLCRKLTALGAQTPKGKWMVIEVGESPLSRKNNCPKK